eukprot:746968-Hanusia_phi.AAC.4
MIISDCRTGPGPSTVRPAPGGPRAGFRVPGAGSSEPEAFGKSTGRWPGARAPRGPVPASPITVHTVSSRRPSLSISVFESS